MNEVHIQDLVLHTCNGAVQVPGVVRRCTGFVGVSSTHGKSIHYGRGEEIFVKRRMGHCMGGWGYV